MRTRLATLLLLTVLLVLPVIGTSAALAATVDAPDGVLFLATESGGELPGLEPRGATDPANEFAPEGYDRPWTWWMGPLLIIGFGPALLGGAALYYFKVHRPTQEASARR